MFVREPPPPLYGRAGGQVTRQTGQAPELAAQRRPGSGAPPGAKRLHGAPRLIAQDVRQHAHDEAGWQIFGQQADQIAAVIERGQDPATRRAANVVDARERLVMAAPAEQLGTEGQINVFEIHEEGLVQ